MSVESLIGLELQQRYRLQALLGRSLDRRTFLATDLQAAGQPQVVVKLFLFSSEANWEAYRLFERETETLKSLDHVAIPTHLDAFDIETPLGEGFALVQTYVPLKSLREWVEAGRRFAETDLIHIATEILAVLNYLHGMQPPVIHRDIKPSNILMGDRTAHSPGNLYLIDFGSVQTVDHGGTRTVVGTYGYMPLEQFGNRAVPASDLYSLGATLIYLATGQHPADLPQNNLKIDFAEQVGLSHDLVQWLDKLVNPEVEKRPASAAIAQQQLQMLGTGLVKLLPARQVTLKPFGLGALWGIKTSPPPATQQTLLAPVTSTQIHAAADQIEIDLPRHCLVSKHMLIFNPYRDHLYQENAALVWLLYLALTFVFPFGNPLLWPQYRWLFAGVTLIVAGKLGDQHNENQQKLLLGYRLRLEDLDGKRYLSLMGLSAQQEIGSRISRAEITRYTFDPSTAEYTLTFGYQKSKYRENRYIADTDKQINLQFDRKTTRRLKKVLDPWCGDLKPYIK